MLFKQYTELNIATNLYMYRHTFGSGRYATRNPVCIMELTRDKPCIPDSESARFLRDIMRPRARKKLACCGISKQDAIRSAKIARLVFASAHSVCHAAPSNAPEASDNDTSRRTPLLDFFFSVFLSALACLCLLATISAYGEPLDCTSDARYFDHARARASLYSPPLVVEKDEAECSDSHGCVH